MIRLRATVTHRDRRGRFAPNFSKRLLKSLLRRGVK